MKKLVLLVVLIAILFGIQAQEREPTYQPFRIQVYTGGPSILKSAFKLSSSFQSEVSYSGKPLLGLSADYRLLKWLSLGADMSYRYGEMNFTIDDSTTFEYIQEKWGIDVTQIANPYGDYALKFPRFRIMVAATAHFLKEESNSDFYLQMGIGYNRVKPKLFKDGSEIRFFNKIGTLSLPVAYRLSLGYAYHFGGHYGIFAEFGIGGPIFSGGLSFRF